MDRRVGSVPQRRMFRRQRVDETNHRRAPLLHLDGRPGQRSFVAEDHRLKAGEDLDRPCPHRDLVEVGGRRRSDRAEHRRHRQRDRERLRQEARREPVHARSGQQTSSREHQGTRSEHSDLERFASCDAHRDPLGGLPNHLLSFSTHHVNQPDLWETFGHDRTLVRQPTLAKRSRRHPAEDGSAGPSPPCDGRATDPRSKAVPSGVNDLGVDDVAIADGIERGCVGFEVKRRGPGRARVVAGTGLPSPPPPRGVAGHFPTLVNDHDWQRQSAGYARRPMTADVRVERDGSWCSCARRDC